MVDSNIQKKTINLLWTGGWDSTFSLLLLMDKDVIIQPYYIIDKQRASYKIEIETMETIRATITNKYPERGQSFLQTKYIDLDEIVIDDEIQKKYQNLQRNTGLGTQYCWIASYAKKNNISDFQMSVVKDGRISTLLSTYSERINDGVTRPYWRALGIPDDVDVSIFSYFHYPVMDYTKLDMLETAKREGFFDILNLSWFCHSPIKREPCGICAPCTIAIEEGLLERLPPKARKRNRHKDLYILYFKIVNKIDRIVKKKR